MITVYGLKNCDTCRKARAWLETENIGSVFHDLRTDGLDADALDRWTAELGWEALLNRRGTTWRRLSDTEKADLDGARARELMLAYPALIKRPVIETGESVLVGWGDAQQAALVK